MSGEHIPFLTHEIHPCTWTKEIAFECTFFFASLTLASRGPTDAGAGHRLGDTRASCHDALAALSKSTVAI